MERSLDLARTLRALMPDEPEVAGLLALLLATDARRATRADATGTLVRLAEQDRGAWDRVSGPAAALAEVESLERSGELTGYRYLPAVKADLLRGLGRTAEAASAYEAAPALTDNGAERDFLGARLAEL